MDFAYEVSRSLAACEGAILVVDATQGVEAVSYTHLDVYKRQPQQVMVGAFQRFPLGTVLLFQLFPQFHIGGDIRDSAACFTGGTISSI